MSDESTPPRPDGIDADADGARRSRDRGVASPSRRSVLALAGAGAATSLAGCLGSAGPTQGLVFGKEMPEITYRGRFKRVGLAPAVNDAGVELGSWEEQGLDVQYKTASGSKAAAKSVASGKDAFGNGGLAAVLQLIEDGAPLVVIGQILDPMGGIVSLEETGITSWTDLEGKVVGLYPFGSTGPAARAAMRTEGVDLEKVTFQNVQPGSALKLLLDGKIDAMIKYFPQMKVRLEYEGKQANVLKTSDPLDHLGVTLYTRRALVENNPERVDRFVKGWLNAFQIWATKVDQVVELYEPLAAGEFNTELERRTIPLLYSAQVPPKDVGTRYGKGWTPADQTRNTIEVFTDAGMLDGSVSPEEVYTNEFIERNRDLAIETAEKLYATLEQNYDVGPNYV